MMKSIFLAVTITLVSLPSFSNSMSTDSNGNGFTVPRDTSKHHRRYDKQSKVSFQKPEASADAHEIAPPAKPERKEKRSGGMRY